MSVDERAQTAIASDWPLFQLRLSTARLELRPPNDDEIADLARIARLGIHGEDVMPFANGWTDYPEHEFGRRFAQYFWSQRASWSVDAWALPFAVFVDGEPVGVQQLTAECFPVLRTVGTGSWLALAHQRRGIGAEMRSAVLHFAFTALDADAAISGAYVYNGGSIGVSRKLGYAPNGTRRDVVRGAPEDALLFLLSRDRWRATGRSEVAVDGFEACAALFGL
jgi:RimJ/RimL family protein N-acetyltransferase